MNPRILLIALALSLSTADVSAQQNKKQRDRNPVPDKLEGGRTEVFKTVGDVKLKIFIFEPKSLK